MLGASREVTPHRLAIAELLLPRARSVQRSLTVSHARLGLARLFQELLALFLRAFQILRDLRARRSLPREGQAQILSLLPGLGLAAGELADLGQLGGNGALPFCESLKVSKTVELLERLAMGTTRFYRRICHQLERCKRRRMLSPVIIGVGQSLLRFAPRTIHLLELCFALSDPVGNGADGEHGDLEQPLCLDLATDGLPVRPCSAIELIETALKVCEARSGEFVITLAATESLPALHSDILPRRARLRGNSGAFFG